MTVFVIWGWLCAIAATVLALPQLIRLVQVRNSAGLSLLSWQLMMAIGAAWGLHGLAIGAPNMWAPNIFMFLCAVAIVWLIMRDRRLGLLTAFGLGLLLAAVLISIDVIFGAAVYGSVVVVPQAIGALGQLRELVRAPDLRGVSLPFMVLSFLTPTMWFIWGLFAPDIAIVIAASITGALQLVNLVWFLVRRLRDPLQTGVAAPV